MEAAMKSRSGPNLADEEKAVVSREERRGEHVGVLHRIQTPSGNFFTWQEFITFLQRSATGSAPCAENITARLLSLCRSSERPLRSHERRACGSSWMCMVSRRDRRRGWRT
jgi:hypothetical protein